MKKLTTAIFKKFAFILAIMGIASTSQAVSDTTKDTITNLKTAYQGETDANARYLAFATKADAEGYKGVAALFRATAKAEAIHAARHASELEKNGVKPQVVAAIPVVGTTLENLGQAIKGETYEVTSMYPEFIAKARTQGMTGAVKAFNLAKKAEKGHAKLFQKALDNIEDWRTERSFWVCKYCGYAVTAQPTKKCPVCSKKPSEFEEVK